ncbi:MAG: hypothetical protein V4640_04905 [Verrucomicrobiota bacterium]
MSLTPAWHSGLLTLVGLVLLMPGISQAQGQDRPPNVIFILADDAGIGDFSTYGCRPGE